MTTHPRPTAIPKNDDITTPDTPKTYPASSNAITAIAGSTIGGIVAILLLAVVILLTVVLVHQRKQKQYNYDTVAIATNSGALQNPVYGG